MSDQIPPHRFVSTLFASYEVDDLVHRLHQMHPDIERENIAEELGQLLARNILHLMTKRRTPYGTRYEVEIKIITAAEIPGTQSIPLGMYMAAYHYHPPIGGER